MAQGYQLEIITPQGQAYSGEVSHTRIPVENGSVGVLSNHAPYITSSSGGVCLVRESGGQEKSFRVGAGFFSVAHNQASFLTQVFEEISA